MITYEVNSPTKLSTDGVNLAHNVLELYKNDILCISFLNSSTITPSYANALVMTLMEKLKDEFYDNICFSGLNIHSLGVLGNSVRRYSAGIRLSTQRKAEE